MASITAIISAIISIVGAIAAYICFYLSQKDKRAVITPKVFIQRRKSGRKDFLLNMTNSGERTAKTISIKLISNKIQNINNSMKLIENAEEYRRKLGDIAPNEEYSAIQLEIKNSYKERFAYFTLKINCSDIFGKKMRPYQRILYFKIEDNLVVMCANPREEIPDDMKKTI